MHSGQAQRSTPNDLFSGAESIDCLIRRGAKPVRVAWAASLRGVMHSAVKGISSILLIG